MRKPSVDVEMAQIQEDLLPSVREMKAGSFTQHACDCDRVTAGVRRVGNL
jgi:hypothetical protein